jgi:hypothetical protein
MIAWVCERPLGLHPFGTMLSRTIGLASHLALCCERSLGLCPLWHCIVKDHWACIPFGTVLWKTIGLASPLVYQTKVKWKHELFTWACMSFMWCFKLYSLLDVSIWLWGWMKQHICIQLQLECIDEFSC